MREQLKHDLSKKKRQYASVVSLLYTYTLRANICMKNDDELFNIHHQKRLVGGCDENPV